MAKKMYKAKCSQCGMTFRRKTRAELLSAIRKHDWLKHRSWMVGRIKAGKKQSNLNNPSIQDLVQAVTKGSSRAVHSVVKLMTEKRYQQIKVVMDAISPLLPLKAQLAWEGAEVAHDIYKRMK